MTAPTDAELNDMAASLAAVRDLVQIKIEVEDELRSAVASARAAGHSWMTIHHVFGGLMTRQGLARKYGRAVHA